MSYTYREMSKDTWADFERLFIKHKGVRGGCWYTHHRCSSSEFYRMTRDERHDFHKSLVMGGRGCGLLLYEAEQPIAWCHYGPAHEFVQYDRGIHYSKLEIEQQLRPQSEGICLT